MGNHNLILDSSTKLQVAGWHNGWLKGRLECASFLLASLQEPRNTQNHRILIQTWRSVKANWLACNTEGPRAGFSVDQHPSLAA